MSEMSIEVVYALPEKQYLHRLTLPQGSSVGQAIERSGLLAQRSEIDLGKNKVGVFSRPVRLEDPLRDGDRVEIYRPLIADPRELRRQRAERAKK
ncbi:RnfH family protein [Edwardsiella ictaluri]|nr:RnfH family protein [Edwardsiella ictaluri]AVZ82898.1 RnfH family protein [Edwardsiella ictaluri]EKS7762429.1 RnfH family protein [Edwardsiella ictaluri]EKS7770826.1 RnfH family protein [Edwardsiella ictaluri]EKS7773970.1 RnfH family protein [Edwardsiella ictaluri]EKS7776044.1 RnfH family protein [Edwardsiella ictaluri]